MYMLFYRSEPVTKIAATAHPDIPVRCVLDCADSSVRIVSPTTGEVLTTLLAPSDRGLVASAYAVAQRYNIKVT